MARKKHIWTHEERDTLELLYTEYEYAIASDEDAGRIFNHVFGWDAPLLKLREEWLYRFRDGRNLNWKLLHSKLTLADYSEEEETRRADVRVHILRAANELRIALKPIATATELHNNASSVLAGGVVASAMPPLFTSVRPTSASTANLQLPIPSIYIAAPASSYTPGDSPISTAQRQPLQPSGTTALASDNMLPPPRPAQQDMAPWYELHPESGQFSPVPMFMGQEPHHYQARSANSHLKYEVVNKMTVVTDKTTGEERMAPKIWTVTQPTASTSAGSITNEPRQDDVEGEDTIIFPALSTPDGPVPNQSGHDGEQEHDHGLWMVHYIDIHVNAAYAEGSRATEPRFQCAPSYKFRNGSVYELGGQVMRIVFDMDTTVGKPPEQQDVMVCNRNHCELCFTVELHEELKGASPTFGRPFVHRGECKIDGDGSLKFTPDLTKDYETGISCQIRTRVVDLSRGKSSVAFDCAVCVPESCATCSPDSRSIFPTKQESDDAWQRQVRGLRKVSGFELGVGRRRPLLERTPE